jgi:hypothetical protein
MPDHPGPAGAILAGVRATVVTRQIVALAEAGGLRPHVDEAGPRQGRVSIILNGPGRDAIFGAIYVGEKTGRILHAMLTHGNGGEEKRYDNVADIRRVLTSWLAICRSTTLF